MPEMRSGLPANSVRFLRMICLLDEDLRWTHSKVISAQMSANVRRQFRIILIRLSNWRSLFLVLLLGCGTQVSAQQSQEQGRESLNYGFVSPNTRDDLKIEEAISGMNSPEESHLLNEAANLACVVRSKIRAFRALGSWSDGAEHSVMLRAKTDEGAVRYLVSRMGRDAQQK